MKRALFILTLTVFGAFAGAAGRGGNAPAPVDVCGDMSNAPASCYSSMVADTCANVKAAVDAAGVSYITDQGGDQLGPVYSAHVARHKCSNINYFLVWTEDNPACGAGFTCTGNRGQ